MFTVNHGSWQKHPITWTVFGQGQMGIFCSGFFESSAEQAVFPPASDNIVGKNLDSLELFHPVMGGLCSWKHANLGVININVTVAEFEKEDG
jgi:hypothetical protein